MPLNPCKNNWKLCLKEELGFIGMQNKNITLETRRGFPPQTLQLNTCWLGPQIRHRLNSVPRQSCCPRPVGRRRRGSWAMLLRRGPYPARRVPAPRGNPAEASSPACTPLCPSIFIILILGLKTRWCGCFSQSRVLGLRSPTCPTPCQENYFFLPSPSSPKRAVFSPDAHATPLNISGIKGEYFSEGFWRGPSPQGPSTAGGGAGAVAGARSGAATQQPGLPGRLKFGCTNKRLSRSRGSFSRCIPGRASLGFPKMGERRVNIGLVGRSIPLLLLPDTEKKIKSKQF